MNLLNQVTRREMLGDLARIASIGLAGRVLEIFASSGARQYRISACDWAIGKRNDPSAMEYAKVLGLDGVQVSLGSSANNMHLRQQTVRQQYM